MVDCGRAVGDAGLMAYLTDLAGFVVYCTQLSILHELLVRIGLAFALNDDMRDVLAKAWSDASAQLRQLGNQRRVQVAIAA